jgi:trans-aconitate methyltransferase
MQTVTDKKDDWDLHWSSYADAAAYNPAQIYRRKLVFSFLFGGKDTKPRRVMDIGCGQGDFALDIRRAYPDAEILGLDFSHAGVEYSKRKVPDGTFIQQDLSRYQEPPEQFKGWANYAVCSEVLEHTDDPAMVLENVKPYMAPGCKLVITLPGGPMSEYDKHIGHRKHYSRKDLRALLEKTGFQAETVTGAGFPFFNLYRLAVVCRGKKVIQDYAEAGGRLSLFARTVLRLFSFLFLFNLKRSPFGWQMVAVARKAEG